MLQRKESKIKTEFKIADGYLDLRTLDTNILVQHLDAEIKKRELTIEKRVKQLKS